MNDDHIFENAVGIEDPCERDRYIRQQCGDAPKRVALISRLVEIHQSNPEMLNETSIERKKRLDLFENCLSPAHVEKPGDKIGPFQLIREIGRGGMAIVFQAKQSQPIQREVAVKIVKPGLETEQVLARMDIERQSLAMMGHRNIASLIDAGISPSGRPYFVMELVNGVSVVEYCTKERLSQRERVRLFIEICEAVGHAHRRGIIHRDIKPSNILVSDVDGQPAPKIIDFGIAKMLAPNMGLQQTLTGMGQIIGTPQYMSPEQCPGSQLQIDTRSDVFSLGAVLYEMLTETPPVDEDTIVRTFQRISDETPKAPSTLDSSIGKDLETICLCCLQKDPDQRYDSTQSLIEDLECFLDNRPIKARPIGVIQRLTKWARRAPVTASLWLAMTIALITLFAVWASFTLTLKSQKDQISRNAIQLEKERTSAVENFSQAHKAIRNYLDAVRTHTPLGSSHDLIFQRELIETGINFYDELLEGFDYNEGRTLPTEQLIDIQLEHASLYMEKGKVLLSSLEYTEAINSFTTARSILEQVQISPQYADAINQKLGSALISLSKAQLENLQPHQAENSLQQSIQFLSKIQLEKNLSMKKWLLAGAWKRLAIVLSTSDRYDEAISAIETATSFSKTLSDISDFQLMFSQVCLERGKILQIRDETVDAMAAYQEALQLIEDVCRRSKPTLRRYTMQRVDCLETIASCQHLTGDSDRSLETLELAISYQSDLYNENPSVEQLALRLAELYERQSHWSDSKIKQDTAIAKSQEIIQQLNARNRTPAELLIQIRMFLSGAHRDLENWNNGRAVERLEIALKLAEKIESVDRPDRVHELIAGIHRQLANNYFILSEYQKALEHFAHYQGYREQIDTQDKIWISICLAELGQHQEAKQMISSVKFELPSETFEMVYFPLVKFLEVSSTNNQNADSSLSKCLEEFQEMYQPGNLIDGTQYLYMSDVLCRVLQQIKAYPARFESHAGFIRWAQETALLCIDQGSFTKNSSTSRYVFSNPRVAVISDLPRFKELNAKWNPRRAGQATPVN